MSSASDGLVIGGWREGGGGDPTGGKDRQTLKNNGGEAFLASRADEFGVSAVSCVDARASVERPCALDGTPGSVHNSDPNGWWT